VDYFFGEEAYKRWETELRDLDYPADLEKELPEGAYDWYEMGNMATQVDQIIRGRAAAAAFCERARRVLPSAGYHLESAARWYRREVELARKTLGPFVGMQADEEARRAWFSDPAGRRAGADAIGRMRELEGCAVRQIQNGLTVAGASGKVALLGEKTETVVGVFDDADVMQYQPRSYVTAHLALLTRGQRSGMWGKRWQRHATDLRRAVLLLALQSQGSQ
jgi:hypothetical protein